MSDIGIRFDGVLLAAAITCSALILGIVGLVALVMAAWSQRHRNERIGLAKRAAIQCGISLGCFLIVVVVIEARTVPRTGIDWIDWMVVPWVFGSGFGLVRLIRYHGSSVAAEN